MCAMSIGINSVTSASPYVLLPFFLGSGYIFSVREHVKYDI